MADLNGESRNKLDAKGRLSLPSKWRGKLDSTLVVMVEPTSECLYAFTSVAEYDAWVESLFLSDGGYHPNNKVHKALRRRVKSRAEEVVIDSAHRISVKSEFRSMVGIEERDVVLIGNDGYIEIWDAKRWDDYSASTEDDVMAYFE